MSPILQQSIQAGAVVFLCVALIGVVRRVLTRIAKRADREEKTILGDLMRALRLPAEMLILLAGLYLALYQVGAWRVALHRHGNLFAAVVTLIVVVAATQAIGLASAWYTRRTGDTAGAPALVGLLRKLAVLAVWVLAIVQILAQLGQPVGTVLASLGIAGLAVGLALQDTIANLFSGFYLVLDRSVRAGDYIKLDSGEEGFVEVVGWRNTRIRLWANNVVLVPNAKLVQSIITNMTLPNPVLSVYTWCGVSYDSDLEHVEQVALEVAEEVLRTNPGADLTFSPVVRFKEFADSNITFVVVFRAIEVGAQYLLQHEFVKALHKRFRQERIEVSYPVRKLVWDERKSLPAEPPMSDPRG